MAVEADFSVGSRDSSYTITQTKFGIVVTGNPPVTELVALVDVWGNAGFNLIVPGIASALRVTLALASAETVDDWAKHLDERARIKANGDAQLEWFLGTETGLSSRTIFGVLSTRWNCRINRNESRTPSDPDDFGRCYRLLQRIPEWRVRLGEVSALYPEWQPLVDHWDELTKLWEEESPTGACPKLYTLMKELANQPVSQEKE